ncbi:PI-PLC X domain-containing protein 1 [Eurosta solidaginis]|uniref:PI-PLC X domain-containing protein 1 n=1 Tax=Eurosta solidaginis TaxID=178769 RepID=UPI0035315F16
MFLCCLVFFCCNLPLLIYACPIYLTISLDGKTLQDANLEVNWGPECHEHPEWIGIFSEDPTTSYVQPEARITDIRNSSGKVVSDVKIGKLRFPRGWNINDVNVVPIEYPKGKCLSYYVASFNGSELLTVECLKIQPNWMSKLEHIAQMPLKDLFIPGTHASAAYVTNLTKTKSVLVKDYVIAQRMDVWSQLVFGVRYLDLSIGFDRVANTYDTSNTDNFFIVNENKFVQPLRGVLREVKHFVKVSHEIVILDFSSFPIGFYKHPERHSSLWHLLHEEFGDIVYIRNTSTNVEVKQCYELTIDEIKKNNKYIIILYPVQELPYPESESKILCPNWKRFSTAFMNTSEALDYMRLLFSKKNSSPVQNEGWVFEAVRSMEQSLNNDKLETAKERATVLNPKVTSWLKGPWSLTANVVALDYFGNTNLIDVSIYANMHKAFNMANKNFINFEIVST